MSSKRYVNLVALCVFGLLNGCTTGGAAPPAATADTSSCGDEYRIGAGDTLNVNVWRNEDLSVTVPVRPDGKISVPLAGDVLVGGETPEQVSATIVERLATFIRDPYVTVIVSNMAADSYRCRVRVTGAVVNPLSIPHREGMTVLDVILEAGGTNEFASPAKTTLFRVDGQRLDVKLDRILKKGDMKTNYTLSPGDIVTVPERIF